jgi:hypothetical protein
VAGCTLHRRRTVTGVAVTDPLEDQAAQWMLDQIVATGALSYGDAVEYVLVRFGNELTDLDPRGNVAISEDVLTVFEDMAPDTVTWDHDTQRWLIDPVGD